MLDWAILDHPINFPHSCIACTNGRGPVAATHRTLPGFGDVYLCERCAEKLSRLFGFAPGERMDDLLHASARVSALERELALKAKTIDSLESDLATVTRRAAELEDDLFGANARIAQMSTRLREEAEASLSLVGDVVE